MVPGAESKHKPILVIQTAFLGDLLLSIPLLKNIRVFFPDHPIFLVTRAGVSSLFKKLHLVDKTFEVKKGNKKSYNILKKQLAESEYKLIFCPHQSLRSALLVQGLNAMDKIGFSSGFFSIWNFLFFTKRVYRNLNLPDALRQLSLLSPFSKELKNNLLSYAKKYSVKKLEPIPEWASMDIANQISWRANVDIPTEKYICFFPGSVWATKKWTEEGFITVGRALHTEGYQIIIMGGPGEEDLANKIANKIPKAISFANKTSLEDSLAILKRSKLVLTNDSAGQHMAAAIGVPIVSIFGPTIISLGYRPWSSKVKIIEKLDLACRPCGKHGHQKCPIRTHECMTGVKASEVLLAAQSFLNY